MHVCFYTFGCCFSLDRILFENDSIEARIDKIKLLILLIIIISYTSYKKIIVLIIIIILL